MSKEKITDRKNCVVLPFKGKTKNKFKNAAMLVAIDMPNNSENLPEERLTKFIEEKFELGLKYCFEDVLQISNFKEEDNFEGLTIV